MTKREIAMVEQWARSKDVYLTDVYRDWSKEKQKAYDWCREKCYDYGGSITYKITGHSCFHFSFAFLFFSKETGALSMCYETYANSYEFEIDMDKISDEAYYEINYQLRSCGKWMGGYKKEEE